MVLISLLLGALLGGVYAWAHVLQMRMHWGASAHATFTFCRLSGFAGALLLLLRHQGGSILFVVAFFASFCAVIAQQSRRIP